MKIHLRVLLPALPEAMGRKEREMEFAGETVSELIDHLVARLAGRPGGLCTTSKASWTR